LSLHDALPISGRAEGSDDLCLLQLLLELARPREVQAGELTVRLRRPRLEGDRVVERVDRVGRVALRLVRRREVAPGLGALRVLGCLLLRVGHGLPGARPALVPED